MSSNSTVSTNNTAQGSRTVRGQAAASGPQTRTLLACGVAAGVIYVAVGLAQALTREGFDSSRHAWSLLTNGDLGWIQVLNFAVAGVLTVACAVGLRRALRPGRGAVWGPRLIGIYGVSLVGAGVFQADPAQGFPAGTPQDASAVSWHGLVHFTIGGIGFLCLIAACFVLARRFALDGRLGLVWFSRATGVLFFAGFAGIASGSHGPLTLAFVASVALVWTWLATVSVHFRAPRPTNDQDRS